MQALILAEGTALIAALAHDTDATAAMSVATPDDLNRQDILVLLQKGWSCRAIATELGVCVPTVKARLMLLYRQTGRHKRLR